MQAKYQEIIAVVKKIISHMTATTVLEQSFSKQLNIAAQRQPELNNEFAQNAEIQHVAGLSLDNYILALNQFCDGLETFCKKTVPDTLATIRQLEHARLVYDAYRNDLTRIEAKAAGRTASTTSTAPITPTSKSDPVATNAETTDSSTTPSVPPQIELSAQQMRQKVAVSREAYLALKKDTDVKMKLLHENRSSSKHQLGTRGVRFPVSPLPTVAKSANNFKLQLQTRVIRKHLNTMQAATLSYFANGYDALNESLKALKECHNNVSSSQNQYEPSFLEAESPSPFTKQPSIQEQEQPQQQKPVYFAPTENGDAVDGEEDGRRDVFQD
ncbi:hypothetical protein Aperf_G00000099669 [Anoplocephala perfoliata]